MEYIESYQKRIKELQGHMVYQEAEKAFPSEETFDQIILTEKPNVRWEDVADLQDAKRAITESIIYPVKRPDLFPLGWPRGILLFGPPGCGKTLLAAAVATEIKAAFFCVDAASIMSKWLGESEKNVAKLFEIARKSTSKGQPAIIFMDEIDSLVGIRSDEVGGEVRTRNQFLKEMDNLVDKSKKLRLYFIGATNKPWALDEPFVRRCQKRIFIPLPDISARLEMFKIFSRDLKLASDVDFYELAMMTDGYSGGDLRDIFQSVQMKVVREIFESGNSNDTQTQLRKISMEDFREIIKERKPSVSKEILKLYDKWFETFKAL